MGHSQNQTLMLYDGVCGLCDFGVQFILSRDHADHFRFATLQSDYAAAILARHGKDAAEMSTFYIVDDVGMDTEVVRDRFRACARVLNRLGGLYKVLSFFSPLMPKFLGDAMYRVVSSNRYRLFGKRDACRLPTAAERMKFITDGEAA